ncbi:hypothetical protein B0H19DRAFT_841251, partial [Mycena capillaripes]
ELCKAYRCKSLKRHPDKGGNKKVKFIVEAKAVLSDPQWQECYNIAEDKDGM